VENYIISARKVINKIFSDESFKDLYFLKRAAFCYRYSTAAERYLILRNKKNAIYFVLKAIIANPIYFFCKKQYLRLLFNLFCKLGE
jgi:hypothetical protein